MINPIGMTATDWCNRMALLLPEIIPMKVERDDEWKAWARHVVQHPTISKYNPPDPGLFFDDWVLWAEQFNLTVPVN